jgi:hypothetical protein
MAIILAIGCLRANGHVREPMTAASCQIPDKETARLRDSAAASAKRYFFASRAAMEAILRPYGLGGTQWWILRQLTRQDQIHQRELASMLHVERATASEIVLTLARKGWWSSERDIPRAAPVPAGAGRREQAAYVGLGLHDIDHGDSDVPELILILD